MSDVTLSKAVRSNLLSLQNTATLMDKTQNRLATGNKVNSALDNPTNFFTASALNARAGDLGALMDSMANGVQTLQAADNGLTAINKTLESMQSVLRQARQDKSFQTASYEISPSATGNITFADGSIGAMPRSIPLQNLALTNAALGMAAATGAGTAGTASTSGSNTLTWPGSAVEVNNDAKIKLTATIDGEPQAIIITRKDVLQVGNGDGTIDSASEFAALLAAKIEGVTAGASGNTITITSDSTGTGSTVQLSAATIENTNYDSDELVRLINTSDHLRNRVRASNDNGKLRIENQSTQELTVDGVNSAGTLVGGTATGAKIPGNSVRADLTKQFNELRDQLDKLSDDASFNGVNLLRGDLLTITFNETGTSSIDVQTKDSLALNSAKLEIFDLEPKDLDLDADIDVLLNTMKNALAHVRTQASNFGQNLSLVENRQNFTKQMINTLQTGAANLTLADMNEEAANLLALQTRQQLSSNSLSLASQADQSVLQLLR